MKSSAWLTVLVLASTAGAWAGLKPVAFRLASLPASAEQGQKLLLCATNVGTGTVDVTLKFINVNTGVMVAEKTVSLAPLGAGAAAQPCLTATAEAISAAIPKAAPAGAAGATEAALLPLPRRCRQLTGRHSWWE